MTANKQKNIKNNRYNNIDGLRALSALAIVMMHVLINGGYQMKGFVFEFVLPSFTHFVFLFMIISGFSMCCGYYEKIKNNQITVNEFYSKRYLKTLPYFAFLILIDLVLSPNINSLYEAFAELTLCFGLLPNPKIQVIGVAWTLGVIFLFYLLFPFFCFLLSNKKRAWFSFVGALIFNIFCTVYFFDENHMPKDFSHRTSFLYCAVFFIAGGLIYLYKDKLEKIVSKIHWFLLLFIAGGFVFYWMTPECILTMIVLFSLLLIYAVGRKETVVLCNPVTRFLSGISMEIYLSHMIIYRVVEKLNLLHIFSSDILSYCVVTLVVVCGTIVFAWITKFMVEKLTERIFLKKI